MLTKKEFESFRRETEEALHKISEKYNVNIHAGGIKYSSNNFDLTLEVTKKEVNGKSFEQAEFESGCIFCGLKPEDYGKNFRSGNKQFIIYGVNLRAKTMPILARDENGQEYKFALDTIKRLIA
jgi:hypothetical protein